MFDSKLQTCTRRVTCNDWHSYARNLCLLGCGVSMNENGGVQLIGMASSAVLAVVLSLDQSLEFYCSSNQHDPEARELSKAQFRRSHRCRKGEPGYAPTPLVLYSARYTGGVYSSAYIRGMSMPG